MDDASPSSSAWSWRRLALAWVVVVAALATHNFEEWLLDMSGWIADQTWLRLPGLLHGDQAQLGVALLVVTAVVAVIAVVAVLRRATWSAGVLMCVAYVLLINGVSHVMLTLVSGSLMPGTITGVAILLPVGGVLAWKLPPVRWTTWAVGGTVLAAAAVTVGSLALAAVIG